MDHLAVVVTNSTPPEAPTPRESPQPSSPMSQHLGVQFSALSPSATSPSMSSSHATKVEVDQVRLIQGLKHDMIVWLCKRIRGLHNA